MSLVQYTSRIQNKEMYKRKYDVTYLGTLNSI